MRINSNHYQSNKYDILPYHINQFQHRQNQLKSDVKYVISSIEEKKDNIKNIDYETKNISHKNAIFDNIDGSKVQVNVKSNSPFDRIEILSKQKDQYLSQIQVNIKNQSILHNSLINKYEPYIVIKSSSKTLQKSKTVEKPFASINNPSQKVIPKRSHQQHLFQTQRKNNQVQFHKNHIQKTQKQKNYQRTNQANNLNTSQKNTQKKKVSQKNVTQVEQNSQLSCNYYLTFSPSKLKNTYRNPLEKRKKQLYKEMKQRVLSKIQQRQAQSYHSQYIKKYIFQNSAQRSISPKCREITQRLFDSRQKIPCPRYEKHMRSSKKSRYDKMLEENGLAQKYLTVQERHRLFLYFQKQKIPEYKWPLKIVDAIYKKLQSIHN